MEKYEIFRKELEHKGVIVDFYSNYVKIPNGNVAKWDHIEHKGAACIIPVTDNGDILLVRQYRGSADREFLEIPAGGLNPGEDMLTCARRELEEETGYRSENISYLMEIFTSPAYCSERLEIYCATHLIPTEQNLDEDEFLEVEKIPLEKAKKMVEQGKIPDAKTQILILRVLTLLRDKKI